MESKVITVPAGCLTEVDEELTERLEGAQGLAGANPGAPSRPPSFAIATLGCKVNQSESEEMAEEFRRRGFRPSGPGESPDVFVVNTCTVTHIADRKSRQLMRRSGTGGHDSLVVVTGCYASTSPEEVAGVQGVDLVVPKSEQSRLVDVVARRLGVIDSPTTSGPPGDRGGAWGRTRAFVKIQDGCDERCTYCIVPAARGASRSVPAAKVLADAQGKLDAGYKEIVLTGVHIGRYGADLLGAEVEEPKDIRDLAGLVRAILRSGAVKRLRLTSIEPMDFDARLIPLWDDDKLARHLHLPLQSGSDAVLERMGRRYSTAEYARLVQELRADVPGISITADVIAGFPGETDEEFQETLRFVRRMEFAKVHVFPFSARKGTPAAAMPGQVPGSTKKERSEALRLAAEETSAVFRRRFVGRIMPVLFERETKHEGQRAWTGLTGNYLRVVACGQTDLANEIRPVRLASTGGDCLFGELAG